MLVQHQHRADGGEQRPGTARDGIDGREVGRLIRLHQQQFVESVHERGAEQAPHCQSARQRQKEQHRRHRDRRKHADQEPHGVFVVGALRQDVDDGV
jgi:hypothetical protein